MPLTVLITGFGPFPGAPRNPTAALVTQLAHRRHPRLAGVRRIAHVFATSYAAVDRELPVLLARECPDALLMFGLAGRTRHVRIETLARNAVSGVIPDATGMRPQACVIAPGAPASLPLRTPGHRLVAAARAAGVPASLSGNAGRYLCNYLCWRASELAATAGGPRLVTFVHVPKTRAANRFRRNAREHRRRQPLTSSDLVRAGEAIMLVAIAAARARR
jgi:pyroglutamyl-peptidase